jgi:PKHD-type hydroxylase
MLQLTGVLSPEQLDTLVKTLSSARFVDGKLSAGFAARRVKHNRELDPSAAQIEYLNNIVMGSLVRHPGYQMAALPHRVAAPYYARYSAGMKYGDHIDDPVMGPGGSRYRCDIAITVFLSGPDTYDGGELAVRTSFGTQAVKLPAGDAILYPASSLHHVAAVTRGERLVAVTWVQSLVRDPHQRELLYELGLAREKLLKTAPDAEETAQVDHAYVNLIRMWAEL